jgi:hypothetical protein
MKTKRFLQLLTFVLLGFGIYGLGWRPDTLLGPFCMVLGLIAGGVGVAIEVVVGRDYQNY